MADKAKLFMNGRSQAVRLPAAYRFEGEEVFIRRDSATGDVVLSARPDSWDGFFAVLEKSAVPDDFLNDMERKLKTRIRDPFEGWDE